MILVSYVEQKNYSLSNWIMLKKEIKYGYFR